jgi:hypothetical protein
MHQKRNPDIKVAKNQIQIIFENDDKGSGAIKLDEKAKFITDFDLTLQGKQEILRTADKSTSLTAHAPIKRNGQIVKNQLEVPKEDINKIFFFIS